MDVPVRVKGQSLQFVNGEPAIASGSTRFVRFLFEFSKDWEGMEVVVRWVNDTAAYESELQEGNYAFLPDGIEPGTCNMVLLGEHEDGRAATTVPIELSIADGSGTLA